MSLTGMNVTRIARAGAEDCNEQAGGETAKDADGGEGAFRCDPAGLRA
jgi:hypothetical protein